LRALGSSVLAFEIIVSILFVPAAIQESSINTSKEKAMEFIWDI
jgi:hypothetical protein